MSKMKENATSKQKFIVYYFC